MSKQKKISYIRERCIEANPSIKDLVFGCEVRYYMDSSMIFCTPANEDDYVTAVYTKNNTLQKIEDIEDYEIIGRPIRLADVLLALKESEHRTEVGLNFDIDGAYLYYDDFENASGSKYNLKQDDLTLQSQETIDFLYSLLNKEDQHGKQ